jgi:hypothetical protein
MVATDDLENHRAANRRVANVAACQASLESPDAETKRKTGGDSRQRGVTAADDHGEAVINCSRTKKSIIAIAIVSMATNSSNRFTYGGSSSMTQA